MTMTAVLAFLSIVAATPSAQVLVARHRIEAGHLITARDLEAREWPGEFVNSSILRADAI